MKNGKMSGRAAAKGKRVVRREIDRPAPVELSAAERAAVRAVCRDGRGERERVIDEVVGRLLRELGA